MRNEILASSGRECHLSRMIISPGRGYIFVHIPRTGGTSLSLALEARAMKDDILIGDTPKAKRRKGRLDALTPKGRLWKHSTLADIDDVLSEETMARMFVFTLVRNPWDRMVSYYHWLRVQQFDHPAVTLAQRLSFEQFVLHAHTQQSFRAAPYESYVTDSNGHERADTYVRLEVLQEDLAPVEEHLGFELKVPHMNRSDRPGDYRAAYSDASAEAVEQCCASDIGRFGYRF